MAEIILDRDPGDEHDDSVAKPADLPPIHEDDLEDVEPHNDEDDDDDSGST